MFWNEPRRFDIGRHLMPVLRTATGGLPYVGPQSGGSLGRHALGPSVFARLPSHVGRIRAYPVLSGDDLASVVAWGSGGKPGNYLKTLRRFCKVPNYVRVFLFASNSHLNPTNSACYRRLAWSAVQSRERSASSCARSRSSAFSRMQCPRKEDETGLNGPFSLRN